MLAHSVTTKGYHGYNVKFSPFLSRKLACAASKNYGVLGPGCLFVLNEDFQLQGEYFWKNGLYDLAWSEVNENIVLTSSADGTIQVWDIKESHAGSQVPSYVLVGHGKEVYCIDWSQIRSQQLVVSGSWDCSAKIWDIESHAALITFSGHNNLVYSVVWSYHIPHCFASVSGDGNLRIWNTNLPDRPAIMVPAHSTEVLSCDWNKYKQDLIVTAAVDGLVKGWDLRMIATPVFQLCGHEYAVRRVKFSPHDETLLASVSYDMTTKLWNISNSNVGPIFSCDRHTEFVYGLDFNVHLQGQFADCAWDEVINIYESRS